MQRLWLYLFVCSSSDEASKSINTDKRNYATPHQHTPTHKGMLLTQRCQTAKRAQNMKKKNKQKKIQKKSFENSLRAWQSALICMYISILYEYMWVRLYESAKLHTCILCSHISICFRRVVRHYLQSSKIPTEQIFIVRIYLHSREF